MKQGSIPTKALTSKQLANKAAGFAEDKKAQDIVVLDMRSLVNFCDYFVIATGTSDRHVLAIVEGIDEEFGKMGIHTRFSKHQKAAWAEQGSEGAWLLLDLGDVVIHIFEPQAREFYGLEHLWQDAPVVSRRSRSRK